MSGAAEKLDIFVKVAAAIAALYGSIKFGLRIHRRIANGVATEVENRIDKKLDDKLDPILKELRPNGGSSLADQVNNVLRKLEHHSGRVKAFNRDTSEGMFESDATGACVWVNRTYCRITERTESEVLGWGWLNIVHPDEVEEIRKHWELCVEEAREYTRIQRYVTPAGEEILCNVRAQPIKNDKGELLSFMGFVRVQSDCMIPTERCPVRRAEDGGQNAH